MRSSVLRQTVTLAIVVAFACATSSFADTTTPPSGNEPPADWGARCVRELEAARAETRRLLPRLGQIDISAQRIGDGKVGVTAYVEIPIIREQLVQIVPCVLPCAVYPSAWAADVETLGGHSRPYRHRSSARHVGTVFDLPIASPRAQQLLVDAADRCLALDGPQVSTLDQRCYNAIEAARSSLVAIDPALATLRLSLMEGSVSATAPPRPGPKRLTLLAMRCELCTEDVKWGNTRSATEDTVTVATQNRSVKLWLTDADLARRQRVLDRMRPIVETCLTGR